MAVTVNSDRYPAMLDEVLVKFKRGILAAYGFNKTTLHTSLSKLHSMFCALFLKIALSAANLISFGHHGAAI